MGRYLGTIKVLGTHVMFMPFYILDYGTLTRLSSQDRYGLFPDSEMLNIKIYNSNEEKSVFARKYNDHQLYIVDLIPDSFEENFNSDGTYNITRYKQDLANLDSSQYGPIDQFGFYYYLNSSEAPGDFNKSYRTIDNPNIYADFKIVIETDDHSYVAGPFNVYSRTQDGENVVLTHCKDNRTNDLFLVNTINLSFDSNEFQNISIDNDRLHYCLFFAGKKSKSYLDVISDEELIKEFKASVENKAANNGSIDLKDIDSIVNSYKTTRHSGIPEEIRKGRVEKLKTILKAEKDLDEQSESITKLIASILIHNSNSEALTPFFQLLSENTDFLSAVPQIKVFREKIQALEDKSAEKGQELQQIETRIAEKRQEEVEELLNKEYDELNQKISNAKDELQLLENKIEQYKGSMTDQEYLDHLKDEISYYERVNNERRVDSEIIEKNIDSIFSERTEKALNLTFDGMISQKMIQAAAEWETERESRQYEDVVGTIARNTRSAMSEKELIDYLCSSVIYYRPNYDKNTVLNLFICLAQGFLTVFSGAPGAGKTSICNIIAHVLGLTIPSSYVNPDIPIDSNRYIDVSVERGWTSKRDFIGYYNPLTKKFDRNNSRLFDALNILNLEETKTKTDRPFVILLDEANLSPMEYYWADFMNVCDDRNDNSSIDLGEAYRFRIPDELRFVATINNDHTTEALSPRLIDRAWIVKLPTALSGIGKTTEFLPDDNHEVLWSEFVAVFGENTGEISGTAKEVYDGFIAKAKKIIRVSPRSDSAIRRYWSVASRLMVKDENVMVDPSIIALDYAIAQKILPQINGSGETVANVLNDLKSFAQDKNLNMTSSMLDEIISRGENTMQFFQYFW